MVGDVSRVETKRRGKMRRRSKCQNYFFLFDTKTKTIKLTYFKHLVQVQNVLYWFIKCCTGSETNCTKGKLELQHIHYICTVCLYLSCTVFFKHTKPYHTIPNHFTLGTKSTTNYVTIAKLIFSHIKIIFTCEDLEDITWLLGNMKFLFSY